MSRAKQSIVGLVRELVASLSVLPEGEKIASINMIRRCIHEASPFRAEPVDFVEWVRLDLVIAPESLSRAVAPGYTLPVVARHDGARFRVVQPGQRNGLRAIREPVKGHIPVVRLPSVAATP